MEKHREQCRESYKRHSKEKSDYARKHYIENKDEIRNQQNESYTENKGNINLRRKSYREIIKEKILDHYGHKCQWPEGCDVVDSETLTIDHIDGGGNKHKREIGGSNRLYKWLIDNNFPEGFRLLCWNHNWKHKCNMEREKKFTNIERAKDFFISLW